MSFSRTYRIDVTRPDADTEHTAVMDLDADLTGAFAHLNSVDVTIQGKAPLALVGAANGVCDLGDDGCIPLAKLPVWPLEKLPQHPGYPIGTVIPFAGSSATAAMTGEWLECDGSNLDSAAYPELYAIIGARFGANPPLFRIPDLRGRFVRGWSTGANNDPDAGSRLSPSDAQIPDGETVGTYQSGQNAKHTHNLKSYSSSLDGGDGSTGHSFYGYGPGEFAYIGATGESEFRPTNVQLGYFIRVL